jgi:hypothetical protein
MIARIFEGPEVAGRLLQRAGAQVDLAGLLDRFAAAIAEDKLPPEVIPGLFPKEPRFGGPEDALRLYGNLFGIWDLLGGGSDREAILSGSVLPEEDEAEEEELEEEEGPPPMSIELPPRGSVEGTEVPHEVVDGTWQQLESLVARERTRRQDRYSNTQSELAEWARLAEGLDGRAQELLEYLSFELAEMFDHAFGDRFGMVRYGELKAAAPDRADALQPYAADYVTEVLDEAEEDAEEPLTADEREVLERHARRALVAMTATTRG